MRLAAGDASSLPLLSPRPPPHLVAPSLLLAFCLTDRNVVSVSFRNLVPDATGVGPRGSAAKPSCRRGQWGAAVQRAEF